VPLRRLLPVAQLATMIIAPLAAPTSAQNIVADVPLAGSGSERVLFAGAAEPARDPGHAGGRRWHRRDF
jgi:hypothetical protein